MRLHKDGSRERCRRPAWRAGWIMAAALVGLALAMPIAAGPTGEHDIETILRKIDELYRSRTSVSDVEMEIVTPHWQRTLTMQMWTKGMDRSFVRILSPRKEKGVGTLRIGSEMWNYLPKTNKVMKIPPSMMMGSWMGSDFTNDDIVNEVTYIEDYSYDWETVESPDPELLYIRCVPHDGVPVVWGYLVIVVRTADYLPVRTEYYDEKDRLMRTMRFSENRLFGDRMLPAVMELVPANKEGQRTIVRYTSAEFDVPVDDDVFSLRNLRSPR